MLEDIGKNLDTTSEIVAKKEQKKEDKKVTTIKPHRGHTLFEWHIAENKLVKATFEKTDVDYLAVINKHNVARRKVIMKSGCIYVSALNEKNAMRKLNNPLKKVQ
jgi:hypothetical protein